MMHMLGLLIGYTPQPMAPNPDFGGGQPSPYMAPAPYPPQPQVQAPYYYAPRRPVPWRPIVATVLAIVGLVVLLISLASPWYVLKMDMTMDSGYEISGSYHIDSKSDFWGTSATVSMNMMGMNMSATCSTSWDSDQMKNTTATKGVFKTTQALDALAGVTTMLLLVGSILIIVRPGLKQIAVIFGLVAVIMCLLGPIYFAASLPAAQKSDQDKAMSVAGIPGLGNLTGSDGPWNSFYGSSTPANTSGTGVDMKMSWGPDSGWYLGWIGFAFTVATFALVFTTKRPSAQQYQYGPSPQYFGQQPQYGPAGPQSQLPPSQQYPVPPPSAPASYPGAPPHSSPAAYPPAQQPPAFEYVNSSAPPPPAFDQSRPPQPAPFQPARPPEPPYSP